MKVICALLGVVLGCIVTNILWLGMIPPEPKAALICLGLIAFIVLLLAVRYDW